MTTLRLGTLLSVRLRPRALLAAAGCVLVALAVGILTLGSGDYPMSPADVLRTLTGGGTPAEEFIVDELRLPRVATALLSGAALGLSGALFQTLVRNPLGSPDVLGLTQGASAGALAVVVAGGSSAALAGGAVLGGLATGAAIHLLARRDGGLRSGRLVLVGIGTCAVLTGVNGYLLTRTRLMDAARAVLWLTGSLDGRSWRDALPLAAALAVLGPLVLLGCHRALTVLELGDDTAAGLGVRVERLRLALFGCAVLLASLAAAAAGPVSFVALTSPQLARRLTRTPGPGPAAAACTGAALLVVADYTAQHLVPGHHLPVGAVTGLLGGGYLLWLLATRRRAGLL